MGENNIQRAIADEFVKAVCESSYKQVRIVKLIESCNVSRTTLYSYFPNKLSIAMYVFRTQLAEKLRNEYPGNKLLFAPLNDNEGDTTELAYYVHDEIGGHALDASGFFKALAMIAQENNQFYRRVISDNNHEFEQQVVLLYRPAMMDDIRFMTGARYLSKSVISMFSTLLADAIVDFFVYAIKHENDMRIMLEPDAIPFWNAILESLHTILRTHSMKRRRSLKY